MAEGGLTLVFDEHFSHNQIGFIADQSRGTHPARLVHVRQRGRSGKPDIEWTPDAIRAGFTLVTAGRNEKTREISVEEFRRLGARVLLFGPFWDHRTRWDMAKWLVRYFDVMIETASGINEGDVLIVATDGKTRVAE